MDEISEYKRYLGTKTQSELFEILTRLDKTTYRERFSLASAEFEKVLKLPKSDPRRNEIIDLTSTITPYFKYFMPGFFNVMLIFNLFGFLPEQPRALLVLIPMAVPAIWLLFYGRSLKYVSIDNDFLYVEGFRQKTKIPRAHIKFTEDNGSMQPFKIKITLSETSLFGDEISFLPKDAEISTTDSRSLTEALLLPEFPQNMFVQQKYGS